jgi:hypothetical protein
VPFSHVDHEAVTDTCRVCHHETLNPCSDCHTIKGSEDAEGVTLYRSMHSLTSEASCIGCHEAEKAEPVCAGCHDQMEQGDASEHGCDLCHAGPLPDRLEEEAALYTSMDDFRPKNYALDLDAFRFELPETVTIGALSGDYEAAEMPHAEILEELREYVRDSSTAVYFHGSEEVLCQGCHHQSPVGEEPPACETCHEMLYGAADVIQPGLRGAYHQQCVGCHDSMKLEEPSDCAGCHEEKQETIGTLAASHLR